MASGVQSGCTGGLANGELEGPLRRSYSSVPFVQVYTGPGGSDSDLPLWPTPGRLWWPIPMNICRRWCPATLSWVTRVFQERVESFVLPGF